jgi:hypothetical protein
MPEDRPGDAQAARLPRNSFLIQFHDDVQKPHRRVDPCFMTGKGCVYREVIDEAIRERKMRRDFLGFMIMPFRHNVKVFFHNCLAPFFENNYGDATEPLSLKIGDEVPRPGVVICEGICKRIQESDFVVVDISLPNDNVFYEFGLAYGIGQKIVVICHHIASWGRKMSEWLGTAGCNVYSYMDLEPISQTKFEVTKHIWRMDAQGPTRYVNDSGKGESNILLYQHATKCYPGWEPSSENANNITADSLWPDPFQDIMLGFGTHVKSAIGLAMHRVIEDLHDMNRPSRVIPAYYNIIEGLKDAQEAKVENEFASVRRQIDNAYCMVVRTGDDCHPMAYFWLGYAYARGKNVIPVTVIKDEKGKIDDLAFDIRALRHMTFNPKTPETLERQMKEAFQQMIHVDFSHWSRKRFWDEVLGRRGEVHIFTGALHNTQYNREMIGDWDLRAAAELTSYFGLHQYRARIETPIYTPDSSPDVTIGRGDPRIETSMNTPDPRSPNYVAYIEQVTEMMEGKNCILIASPDVNSLTEIVLGRLYGVPDDRLFKKCENDKKFEKFLQDYNYAIVSVKEKKLVPSDMSEVTEQVDTEPERAFYRTIITEEVKPCRGFMSRRVPGGKILTEFASQWDPAERFDVYAHLAILPNPFKADPTNPRYIIILNGVSGPATFALTHVLTGRVNEEFVDYDEDFNPDAEAEGILKRILDAMQQKRDAKAWECIFKVTVDQGPTDADGRGPGVKTFDWRRIKRWTLVEEGMSKGIFDL